VFTPSASLFMQATVVRRTMRQTARATSSFRALRSITDNDRAGWKKRPPPTRCLKSDSFKTLAGGLTGHAAAAAPISSGSKSLKRGVELFGKYNKTKPSHSPAVQATKSLQGTPKQEGGGKRQTISGFVANPAFFSVTTGAVGQQTKTPWLQGNRSPLRRSRPA